MVQSTLELSALVKDIPPITPDLTVDYVGELLRSVEAYQQLLSLPIVDNGIAVGVISRYELMNIFLNRFGRELHGKKLITELMNPTPLMVELDSPLEAAAQFITENMRFPITEDFIINHDGRYRGVGMVLDLLRMMESKVTRRTKELASAYKHLKHSQAQLIQSEKMASLGQMVAGVAHEINTPLGYVQSNIELMSEIYNDVRGLVGHYHVIGESYRKGELHVQANPKLAASLEEIDQLGQGLFDEEFNEQMQTLFSDTLYGLEQISELVLNLKDFSRLDKAKVDNVSIHDCIESALLIGRNNIKHCAEVIKKYEEIPAISCSPSQINQVLLNILNNAAQAIEGQGKITIHTYHDDDNVYVSIRDTGKGIPEDNLGKIFDPFFTTKPVGEGSGMGLSITYKIIEQHKGRIRVSSKPGEGTKFTIQLPIHDKSTTAGSEPHLQNREAPHGTETYSIAG